MKALILMYHRTSEVHADPFSLNVTPEHFGEQLDILRRRANPVHLRELATGGALPERPVVLTFDDGYADNREYAQPLLERYDIPATIFVATGFVGSSREMWWDELERVFLEPGLLPESLDLMIGGCGYHWSFGEHTRLSEADCQRHRQWRVVQDAPTPRHAAYFEVWRLVQLLPHQERLDVLDRIAAWCGGIPAGRASYRGISAEDALSMAAGGLIHIGAHTVTHPALPVLSSEDQRNQILGSRAYLEEILGRPVGTFAYPYGACSQETVAIVREAGFDCACTTQGGFVDESTLPHELPRVQVHDWSGEEFEQRLAEWFEAKKGALVWGVDAVSADQVLAGGKWSFRASGGNMARLIFPGNDPDHARVDIEHCEPSNGWDIQLNLPNLAVEANRRYTILFSARADGPRSLALGFAQAHAPWNGLGLYQSVELSQEWQSFAIDFDASADDSDGRIHFDAGGSGISIEVLGARMEEAPDLSPKPLVTAVMNFFNAGKFIQEAIESIVGQRYRAWELILVDDGSSDESTGIARSYAGRFPGRIVYLEHPEHCNRGTSASRNLGATRGLGKYVAYLDADDVWMPDKLEKQVAIMERHPTAAMVYGASSYWHSWTGRPEDLADDHVPDLGVETEVLFDPPVLLTRLYPFGVGMTPPPSDFIVRREALDAIGGWEEESPNIYDDQAFLAKMYMHGSIFVSSEQWLKYRIHPDSCGAMETRRGNYNAIRGWFLKWFEDYLRERNIRDPHTWSLLRDAVMAARLQFRSDGGNVARLSFPANDPGWMRIAIERAAGKNRWDVQLNLPYYPLRINQRYVLRFQARADQPRGLSFGVAEAHAPWGNLGLHQEISLTTGWETFESEFLATGEDANGRIHFDAGGSDVAVELTAPSLRRVPGGEIVEPTLPLIHMDQSLLL